MAPEQVTHVREGMGGGERRRPVSGEGGGGGVACDVDGMEEGECGLQLMRVLDGLCYAHRHGHQTAGGIEEKPATHHHDGWGQREGRAMTGSKIRGEKVGKYEGYQEVMLEMWTG